VEQEECKCKPGLPAWLATFADLMSLLMCFFVLLLAFSEMDVMKFKQIAGSMRFAFGVQSQIDANQIPKGTSIIAQEFSPGKPDPTPIRTIQQETVDNTKQSIDITEGGMMQEEVKSIPVPAQSSSSSQAPGTPGAPTEKTEAKAKAIAQELKQEITTGKVEVEAFGRVIVIRIREKGSFISGDADVRKAFKPVLAKIAAILVDTDGMIRVAGHTDNIPIDTDWFRSNWELSSGRAVSVAHELLKNPDLEPERFSIVGHADTQPLVANDTRENRAKNRRVEISIVQGQGYTNPNVISAEPPAEEGATNLE
jgi:chemotaxis protein MotB